MVGSGKFASQLNDAESILRRLKLLGSREAFPNKRLVAGDFRGLDYISVYKKYVDQISYDFKLSDQSLILFCGGSDGDYSKGLSYCYIEAPVDALSYEEFVALESAGLLDEITHEELIEYVGDSLRVQYDDHVTGAPLRKGVCPIRFDYSPSAYREGVHPASHFHFGFENHSRIAARRVISPLGFLLFIIRQRYPREWELLRNEDQFSSWICEMRDALEEVEETFWKGGDHLELHLF
jgi:hypothetical protein